MKIWGWLSLGLILGLAGGLVYTWVLSPPEYYDTYPPLMDEPYRRDWIGMTALAYGVDGDWSRTQLRLHGMEQAEIQTVVAAALEDAVNQGRPMLLLQRLAHLGGAAQAEYGRESVGFILAARGMGYRDASLVRTG